MEEFAGVTLDDVYRVETTLETNVCVYKLVNSDAEDGKSIGELVRRSSCHYPDTMHFNLHETHFPFIQDVRLYCYSYRCQKCGDSIWKDAYRQRSHERPCTGCVRLSWRCAPFDSISVWKMRTFESPNRCATIRTEPPLTLSVGWTPHNFRWTVTRSTG